MAIHDFTTHLARLWRLILLALCWAIIPPCQAEPAGTPEIRDDQDRIQLYFFWSARCPHCLEARPHLLPMVAQHPWIELHDLEISRHPENVQRYVQMAAALGQEAQSVPAFLFCGEMHVGWHSAETTGTFLMERLKACRSRAAADRKVLEPAALETLRLPLVGEIDPQSLSLPAFTVVIAGLDAFNPCAFFVLLFLLGLLAHQKDRRRMLAIGGVFVVVSGLFYFAFMAAWLNLFILMGELYWVTLAAALLAIFIALVNIKDFFAFKQGLTLSIPESRLPDLYRRGRAILAAGNLPAMLAATLLLAGAANLYELLCTAGFPMAYTRVLTLNNLEPTGYYLYLALYNLIYVIPLLVIVLAVTYALGRRQLSERQGRLLKLMSGVMMLELGLLLLAAPQLLNNVGIAFALLLGAVGVTALVGWFEGRRRV